MSFLGRLFGRTEAPPDPLVERLPELVVPQSEAGAFVAGYQRDERQSRVITASPAERRQGAIAQYMLQWDRSMDAIRAQLAKQDATPFVQWVRQLVLAMVDATAAQRWFAARASGFKAYAGQEVGGFRYGEVQETAAPGIGDEALVLAAPNERHGVHYVDTYINLRCGRLFGSVSASTWGTLNVERDLRDLAVKLATRLTEAEPH